MARGVTLSYLRTESGSGLILAAVAIAAVALANSPFAGGYFGFREATFTIQLGVFHETRTIASWVKDGLMAVFFLVIGMELKFEVLKGELANPRRLALPVMAALGGLLVPAAIYLFLNLQSGGAPQGWPTPVTTDIAFAVAALAIAGPKLPPSLRVFLLTAAIADDLGAVGLIALLFTADVHVSALIGAGLILIMLAVMGRWKRAPFLFYALGFILVWAFTLKSGINTSLAGVACALTVPVGQRRPGEASVLKYFMGSLHPYVAYLILPLFAFVAAGFSLEGLSPRQLTAPLPLGVALGLFIGKPVGVLGFAAIALVTKAGRRPTGATWAEMLGVAMICGVGFTMSLFIGELAFPVADEVAQAQVRLGVIAGSLLSLITGGLVLRWAQMQRLKLGDPDED